MTACRSTVREIIPRAGARRLTALFSLALLSLALGGSVLHCGAPQRGNPFDPEGAPSAALAMRLPLPKALAAVVSRVEASLEGPGLRPVVKVLDHSPLGPATGVLGALQPGVDRVLTVRGFDLDDALIFEGQARGIAITAGDTVRVQLDLFLVGPTPSDPDPPVVDEGTETGGAGPGDDEVPIDGPPDEAGEPVEEGVPADPPEVGTPVGDESPDQEENTSQEESAAQTEGEADGEPPEVPEDSVPVTEDNNSGDAAG